MLMKYNDFKKMSANEMKEVKGGVMPPPRGQLINCGFGNFCIAAAADPLDCGPNCVVVGLCPDNGAFC